jgi:hypothetical protein
MKRKRFDDLLRRPPRRGMFRHIEVNDSSSVMGEYDEDEQHTKPSSRNNEEVDRHQF